MYRNRLCYEKLDRNEVLIFQNKVYSNHFMLFFSFKVSNNPSLNCIKLVLFYYSIVRSFCRVNHRYIIVEAEEALAVYIISNLC